MAFGIFMFLETFVFCKFFLSLEKKMNLTISRINNGVVTFFSLMGLFS